MSGAEPDRFERPADPLADDLQSAVESHLLSRLAGTASSFDGSNAFEGRFHVEIPRVLVTADADPEILMIETPRRRDFDRQWRVGYDTTIPASVTARANVRMAVASLRSTVLWVVGDNGAIDEFHRITRDDKLVATLRTACRSMETSVAAGDEPSPDDDDLSDYILALKGPPKPVLRVAAASPEAEAFRTLEAIEREIALASDALQQRRNDQKAPRSVLVRACAGRKGLEIEGRLVRAEMVQVNAKERKSYSFPRVVVDDPETR